MANQDKSGNPVQGYPELACQPKGADRLRLNSRDLFAMSREIIIDHASEEYRLRLTSQGKLILTK